MKNEIKLSDAFGRIIKRVSLLDYNSSKGSSRIEIYLDNGFKLSLFDNGQHGSEKRKMIINASKTQITDGVLLNVVVGRIRKQREDSDIFYRTDIVIKTSKGDYRIPCMVLYDIDEEWCGFDLNWEISARGALE